MMVRAIKDITADQWMSDFRDQDLQLSDDFDEMVTSLNKALKMVLDNLAPEKKVLKSLKPKHPWYNSGLRSHKKKVQKLEKSGLNISWIHFG